MRPSSAWPAATADPEHIREAAAKGRIDGTLESLTLVLTDATLADCIKELGDHADNPSSDQLRAVLPGLVERHGLGATRLMLASTLAGEAAASAVIRDLLKNDELVKLPKAETPPPVADRAGAEGVRRRARRHQGPAPGAQAAQAGRGPHPPRAVRPRPQPRLTRFSGALAPADAESEERAMTTGHATIWKSGRLMRDTSSYADQVEVDLDDAGPPPFDHVGLEPSRSSR